MRFWRSVLADDGQLLASVLTEVVVMSSRHLGLVFENIWDTGRRYKSFFHSYLGLRRYFPSLQRHRGGELEVFPVEATRARHVLNALHPDLLGSLLLVEEVCLRRLEGSLGLRDVLEDWILLLLVPVRDLLTEVVGLLIDLLGFESELWHLLDGLDLPVD